MLKKIKNLLPSKRKIMQLYFAVLFNANLKGFVTGNIYRGNSKTVCAPGINCYSCPGAIAACPLGSLQGAFSADHSTLYYVCGLLLLYCIIFGRVICGWLCPFGLVQDLLYKIKTPKLHKNPVTRILSLFKYVVLVFFVVIVPILYALRDMPLPAFCKYICPAGTLEGGIGLLSNAVNESYFSMLGPLFTWKFLLMVSILTGCIFVFRLFCRFICPLGALYGLFNKFSLLGIRVKKQDCIDCGVCLSVCKCDIKTAGDRECIHCGMCVDACPTQAISWKGSKIFLKANETAPAAEPKKRKTRRTVVRAIVAGVMALVLIGTVGYYWSQESGPNLPIGDEGRGNQVGDFCYRYDLPVVTGEGVTEQTIDPASTGKVTVINFWGTWCTPCVAELPYFDQIATEYADQVTVFAVHSAPARETAPEYIAEHYPQTNLIFGWDDGANGDYYTMLGGRGPYPYTLVLDADGMICQVFVSSLTYEELKAAVDSALG